MVEIRTSHKIIGTVAAAALTVGMVLHVPASSGVYPDVKGAINPDITQANIGKNICAVRGTWSTSSIRPSSSVTNKIKKQKLPVGHEMSEYELDHLISIELGGAPASVDNLWDEPWNNVVKGTDYGAHTKDKVENYLHAEVCAGHITLADAQHEIATDWVRVYQKYIAK